MSRPHGKWVVVGPYQDALDIPAKARLPPSVTSWQSPWMRVPKQCQRGTEPRVNDGYITGWSQSDASAVVAQIKLLG